MKALIEIKQLNNTRRHTICFSKEARDLIDSKEIIIYNKDGDQLKKDRIKMKTNELMNTSLQDNKKF